MTLHLNYKSLLLILAIFMLIAESSIANDKDFEKMGVVRPKNELPAPGFSLETSNGNHISLDDFKGKTVLLNFWATWCKPCRDELPSMQRLYESLRLDGVEIIAISIDRNKKEKVKEFANKYNLTFPVLLDPSQKVRKDYFIMGLPTSYLIGVDGKLKGFISGARDWDSKESKKVFATLTN